MADYEIVIHLRDSTEPTRIALPGVSGQDAEAEREALIYDLDQARSAGVPMLGIQTRSGFPPDPLPLDPHLVTEVGLVEMPVSEDRPVNEVVTKSLAPEVQDCLWPVIGGAGLKLTTDPPSGSLQSIGCLWSGRRLGDQAEPVSDAVHRGAGSSAEGTLEWGGEPAAHAAVLG